MDDGVDLRAIQKVVVNRSAGDGSEDQLQRKAVVNVRERGRVPHQCIAFARNKGGNRDIRVVLSQFHRGAAIVEQAALVLAKPVERLQCDRRERIRDAQGVIAVQPDGLVGSRTVRALPQQVFARG